MIEPIYSDRWIEKHAPSVFRTCRQHTKTPEAAWDAFQETFLTFTKKRGSLDLSKDPLPWLKETARRCSMSVVRKTGRQPFTGALEINGLEDFSVGQMESAALKEAVAVLTEELQGLPENDRLILQLIYVEGRSHRDVASQIDCAAGSVNARAENARGELRRRMQRRGVVSGILLLLFLLHTNSSTYAGVSSSQPIPASGLRWKKVSVVAGAVAVLVVMFWSLPFRVDAAMFASIYADTESADESLSTTGELLDGDGLGSESCEDCDL
ncbi:MAG: sigma-70 family RNA polymerase sigma factor [Fuerstiella sp.]